MAKGGPAELAGLPLLAVAIEKALANGRVSRELRGQVRDLMTAESENRLARGERFRILSMTRALLECAPRLFKQTRYDMANANDPVNSSGTWGATDFSPTCQI